MKWVRNILSPSYSRYYPDIPLLLILIPFIAAFNYHLTYTNVQWNRFLAITYTLDVVDGYAAVFAVRYLVLYLDRVLPYEQGMVKRVLTQLVLTTLLGLFIIAFLTEVTSLIARGKMVASTFYTDALLIISIWFFVLNGIYLVLYFFKQSKAYQQRETVQQAGYHVKVGNKELRLAFEDIQGFGAEGDYVFLIDKEGKKYVQNDSLSRIEEQLPPFQFFRLNRQYILNKQLISGFRRLEHGKIQAMVEAQEPFPPDVTISRLKAASFKQWYAT